MIEKNTTVSNITDFIKIINKINSEQYTKNISQVIIEKLKSLSTNSNEAQSVRDYFKAIIQSQSVGDSFYQDVDNRYLDNDYSNEK